ncbi:MAG: acylphosphatase [Candidatus Omnitrophica bacterium]|nr:acylphosphatase [Candidatus Omnitrophota bacterium]
MDKRLHAYYSGSVQGVGFRFTAERVAGSLGLRGWVKNLRDGRVEVLAEGEESDLNGFLRKIETVFKDYIRDIDLTWEEATGEFSNFDIAFF